MGATLSISYFARNTAKIMHWCLELEAHFPNVLRRGGQVFYVLLWLWGLWQNDLHNRRSAWYYSCLTAQVGFHLKAGDVLLSIANCAWHYFIELEQEIDFMVDGLSDWSVMLHCSMSAWLTTRILCGLYCRCLIYLGIGVMYL